MDEVRFRSSERAVWASVGVTPSERRVRLVRTGCTVRVQESGSGPAVLFVHGAASGGTSWADLVARLQGFRCLMVDRPGCALSDPLPAPLRRIEQIEAYADGFVVDVLDALDLERAHVVATSYGGYFALRGAAAHPDRFERIVELGWTIGAPMSKVPFILRLLAVPGVGRLLSGVMPTNERVVRRMLRQAGLGRALDSGTFSPLALAYFTSVLRDTPTMRNELSGTPRVILPIRGMNHTRSAHGGAALEHRGADPVPVGRRRPKRRRNGRKGVHRPVPRRPPGARRPSRTLTVDRRTRPASPPRSAPSCQADPPRRSRRLTASGVGRGERGHPSQRPPHAARLLGAAATCGAWSRRAARPRSSPDFAARG